MSRPRRNCRTLLMVDGHRHDGTRWRPDNDPFWSGSDWRICAGAKSYRTLRHALRDVRALRMAGYSGTLEHDGRNGYRFPLMRVRVWEFKGAVP